MMYFMYTIFPLHRNATLISTQIRSARSRTTANQLEYAAGRVAVTSRASRWCCCCVLLLLQTNKHNQHNETM